MDDSIEYVKNLHHRIKSLQERKVEMNQSKAATRKGPIVAHGAASSPKEPEAAATPTALSRRARLSEEQMSGIHDVLRSCLERMEVHADLPHQVVIEMVCKPQPRLQSNILLCMESLKLDVLQCSITKIAHRLICVITAKVIATKAFLSLCTSELVWLQFLIPIFRVITAARREYEWGCGSIEECSPAMMLKLWCTMHSADIR